MQPSSTMPISLVISRILRNACSFSPVCIPNYFNYLPPPKIEKNEEICYPSNILIAIVLKAFFGLKNSINTHCLQ